MPVPITMPKLGFEMLEGTLVAWLKKEGDQVRGGDLVAEVETDKAIVELEAPAAGTILGFAVHEGETVAVGTPLAYIGHVGEELPKTAANAQKNAVSPIALRTAADHGIDLATVHGTGPNGRVTRQDVLDAADGAEGDAHGLRVGFPPRLPDSHGKITLGPMGEAIARRTEATMRDVPHFYESIRVDMTDALDYRRSVNAALSGKTKVGVNDMIIKACTLALLKYPVFNSTYEGDHLRVQPHVNMGLAVAMQNGLMVPAVLSCEAKSLPEIAEAARDLVFRAKDGKLKQAEYSGTFTISNLGMYGVDQFTIVIVRPQVAILGVAAVKPSPAVVGKEIAIRQMTTLSVGCDHRAIQGAEAAQFLGELRRLLEEPALLGE